MKNSALITLLFCMTFSLLAGDFRLNTSQGSDCSPDSLSMLYANTDSESDQKGDLPLCNVTLDYVDLVYCLVSVLMAGDLAAVLCLGV